MDPERELRAELMAALSAAFECWEHVSVRHAFFASKILVADVIAIPRDPNYFGLTFAFEVKNPLALSGPKGHLDVPFWTRAIHQASDYVYGSVEPKTHSTPLSGRRISSAFIFPTTCLSRRDSRRMANDQVESLMRVWGAFELGVHSRVGKAAWEAVGKNERGRLNLWVGNDVWRSDVGFRPHAPGILRGKRRLGSQDVDVLSLPELTGIDLRTEQ